MAPSHKPVCSSTGPVLKLTQVSVSGTDDYCCGSQYVEITNIGGAVANMDGYVLTGGNMTVGLNMPFVLSQKRALTVTALALRLHGHVPNGTSLAGGATLRVCNRRLDVGCEAGTASGAGVDGTRAAGNGDRTAGFGFSFDMTTGTTVSVWDSRGLMVDSTELEHEPTKADPIPAAGEFNKVRARQT